MNRFKKIITLGLAMMLTLTNISKSDALSAVDEIKGINRYETAAKIAEKQNYKTAILVNADNSLADGLCASGLAGATNAPILLTQKDSIPTVTINKLRNVEKVYIVGGVGVISPKVESTIESKGIVVERLSGDNRYETSYKVAQKISQIKTIDKIFLTNGFKGEADAMSIASVAARDGVPIILTDGQSVPFDAKSINSFVIGESTVMSDKIAKATNSTRLGGLDRFATNKKIIQYFYSNAKEFYITKGYQLVDALTASPIAKNTPIVLVHSKSDKTILKGATKVTAIGGVDPIALQESINATNGIFTPVEHSFAAKLKVSNQTDQIITVVGTGGYNCKVILHNKVNGIWKETMSTNGYTGKKGITNNKREGDGMSPTGVYSFGTGFGVAKNPGASIPYRVVTKKDYWVDDPKSKYYNKWVTSDVKDKDWKSAEHLASYPKQYKYGAVINYNTQNIVPGKGSAIFLHVSTGGPTAGCISIPESSMVQVLKNLKSNARIVIAKNMNDIMKY